MDHFDPPDMDAPGQGRSSRGRPFVLGAILAVLVVGFSVHSYLDWQANSVVRKADDEFAAFTKAVAKADAITDPLQRCLSYPDLPDSHWNADTTRAYCEFRNYKTISLADIDTLLKQGRANEVDRIFQGYLDTQRADPKQPGLLDIAFINAGFDTVSGNARRIIDMWKQQSPRSAFVLAASGMQYSFAASQARGYDWNYKLTDQQVEGMQQFHALAMKDLVAAISIEPRLTSAYPSMIDSADGDDRYMYKPAALGLKQDPSNYGIRLAMMNYAQPRWGSSFGGVDRQSAEDSQLAARNPLLQMIAQYAVVYQVTCECNLSPARASALTIRATDKNVNENAFVELAAVIQDSDRRLTVELYDEVLRFDPTRVDVLRWREQELVSLGDRQDAMAGVEAMSRLYPDDLAIATFLGSIYSELGEAKKAESTLLAVLQRDPDNYEALGWLGDLYNHAAHQPQKAETLADILVSKYPERPYGYIVRSCHQMDYNLPGVYDTIHFFIDRFGDDPTWKAQSDQMRAYLIKHPEKVSA